MRLAVVAGAAVALLGWGPAAWASETYTLVNQVYNQAALDAGGILNFSFTVSNAAVDRGSFDLQGTGDFVGPVTYTGDVADFISFTANETATPSECSCGSISIMVNFAPDGSVSSSDFSYFGIDEGSQLSGSSAAFGGIFNSDNFDFGCSDSACSVTGQLVAEAPEPAAISLVASGLLGLGLIRRRKRG